jgi:probable rRNA maturation factor
MTNTLTISHTTRSYPKLPYQEIAKAVVGTHYQVSLTFLGADRARQLNTQTRGKTYVPNVLSFPLDEGHGEIYIAPTVASKEAVAHGMTARGYVGYLFIHGLLHLKGYDHGSTMEKLEKKYCTKFQLK